MLALVPVIDAIDLFPEAEAKEKDKTKDAKKPKKNRG
jgi:hypothetical protein